MADAQRDGWMKFEGETYRYFGYGGDPTKYTVWLNLKDGKVIGANGFSEWHHYTDAQARYQCETLAPETATAHLWAFEQANRISFQSLITPPQPNEWADLFELN